MSLRSDSPSTQPDEVARPASKVRTTRKRIKVYFPSCLLAHMAERVPGFSAESPRDQRSLACMLWMSTHRRRQHVSYRSYFSLCKQDIRDIWGGSDQRMRDVVWTGYFSVLKGDNLGTGYTNAFQPSSEMADALQACLDAKPPDDWVDTDGAVLRTLRAAIASMSGAGNRRTKWIGLAPANSVQIDVPSLMILRKNLDAEARKIKNAGPYPEGKREAVDSALRRLDEQRTSLDALVKLSRNKVTPGCTPIRYNEQSTGRIFAEGVSLQAAPREVRSAALVGCYDYDISNCHWALMNQLAAKEGFRCEATQHYLANKKKVRQELADGAGITPDEAKECLLMVMYGAPKSLYKHKEGAILEHIGLEAAQRLFKQPAFIRLHAEVRRAREVIVNSLPVQRGGVVVNALGLQVKRKASPEASAKDRRKSSRKAILAHILQGLEAKALMAVVAEYGDRVQVCIHDGWVTREPLVLAEVQRLIVDAIGIAVEVEVKQLPPVQASQPADSLRLEIKDVEPPETQQPCGFPGDFGSSQASSDGGAGAAGGSGSGSGGDQLTDVASEIKGGGIILSCRPAWIRSTKPVRSLETAD